VLEEMIRQTLPSRYLVQDSGFLDKFEIGQSEREVVLGALGFLQILLPFLYRDGEGIRR
jgi:hypothetical protein